MSRLPAAAWGEKDGTVTNSERRISRQRRFLPLPGEARPDWWIISRSRQAHGLWRAPSLTRRRAEFSPSTPRCPASRTTATRDFDIGAFAEIDDAGSIALEPFQWPRRELQMRRRTRFFGDGRFFTPDRKARFVRVRSRRVPARTPRTSR